MNKYVYRRAEKYASDAIESPDAPRGQKPTEKSCSLLIWLKKHFYLNLARLRPPRQHNVWAFRLKRLCHRCECTWPFLQLPLRCRTLNPMIISFPFVSNFLINIFLIIRSNRAAHPVFFLLRSLSPSWSPSPSSSIPFNIELRFACASAKIYFQTLFARWWFFFLSRFLRCPLFCLSVCVCARARSCFA